MAQLDEKLKRAMEKHGHGKTVSDHESLGIITEEYHELIDAVRANDGTAWEEMIDLAVAAVFGAMSCREPR
jgi:hypothetical protein